LREISSIVGRSRVQVLERLNELGWLRLRGNHEDYVIAQCVEFVHGDPLANPIWQPARWTAEQLNKDASEIALLPLTTTLQAPDGSEVLIAHGTPQVNNDGVFGRTTDEEIRAMLGHNHRRFLYAHIPTFP
jgi:hypothetical protein